MDDLPTNQVTVSLFTCLSTCGMDDLQTGQFTDCKLRKIPSWPNFFVSFWST